MIKFKRKENKFRKHYWKILLSVLRKKKRRKNKMKVILVVVKVILVIVMKNQNSDFWKIVRIQMLMMAKAILC